MERDFAAYLFTLFCPLFTSGAYFSIAHEYSVRNLNASLRFNGHFPGGPGFSRLWNVSVLDFIGAEEDGDGESSSSSSSSSSSNLTMAPLNRCSGVPRNTNYD